jgi:thiol-disulfide isomerase/thioredoxin
MSEINGRKYIGFALLVSLFALASLAALSIGCSRSGSEKTSGAATKSAEDDAKPLASNTRSDKESNTGRAVLEAMAKAYRGAKSYADKGTVRLTAEAGGKPIDQQVDFSAAYQRPNKLRMDAYSAMEIIDGKKLYAYIKMDEFRGQVLEKEAPAELTMKSVYGDNILRVAACNGFAGALPQVLLLLDGEAMKILLNDAEEPKLAESGEIEGRKCYRVQIPRPDGVAVLWIDKETLVLRRMVLPTDEIRAELGREIGAQVDKISLAADFAGAQLNDPVDPRAFQFEVPTDAEIVKYFPPPDPGQLLAKKTPQFRFVGLDGKTVTTESLTGKIVVMDFWETTCGPCRVSFPKLQEVYEKYKDNDKIAFMAISVDGPQVENKAIEDLLRELKVNIPAYRDPEGAAGAFKFRGIPSSFIIDAKGTVQDYEAGASPDLPAALTQKIEKLLAGGDIFDTPLKRYQEDLKQYEKFMTSQEEGKGAGVQDMEVPLGKVAPHSEPKTLRLSPLWKSTDLKSPGNILVIGSPSGRQRLVVIEGAKSLAEVGLDGKTLGVHELNIGQAEFVTNIRSFTGSDGKTYFAVFAGYQQRCHVLDDQWNMVLHYPENALDNPHGGIADVEPGDLDGDGVPKLYVGYLGVVGVQAATLEGKRIWSNRSISSVARMAIANPDSDGRRLLLCVNNSGNLVELDAKGQRQGEITVPNRPIGWVTGGDLRGDGRLLWCGLSAVKLGETTAFGFDLEGHELWSYALPVGVPPQPIEQIIPGRIANDGPGQWILPGPDASINILSAEGKLLDSFNYGIMLQGLATVVIDGRPVLIVASPNGLEAWKIE